MISDNSEASRPISCVNTSRAAALRISFSSSDAGWLKRHDMPTAMPVSESQSGTNPMSVKRKALIVIQRQAISRCVSFANSGTLFSMASDTELEVV